MTVTIALDAMGGDYGPPVVIAAAVSALKHHPDLNLVLVGRGDVLRSELKKQAIQVDRFTLVEAEEVVTMDEPPAQALRTKRKSSIWKALELVKNNQADACVSAGNTGALMAMSRLLVRTVSGVSRPAIVSQLPAANRYSTVLDLGANVDSSAEQLLQFAIMGSVLVEAVDGISNPRVGLLNVGKEDIKGNEVVKSASQLLQGISGINYVGYVEGDDLFQNHDVDVIVCDGFVGNIALKASEGLAKLVRERLRSGFEHSIWTKLIGLLAGPVFKELKSELDPRRYNGAGLLGLTKPVVKSHGSADSVSFEYAISRAVSLIKQEVPKKIENKVAHLLQQH